MDQEQQTTPEPRSIRDYPKDREASRKRGTRNSTRSRWALRSLPPIEEDEP